MRVRKEVTTGLFSWLIPAFEESDAMRAEGMRKPFYRPFANRIAVLQKEIYHE
jgi:hypothetical protein